MKGLLIKDSLVITKHLKMLLLVIPFITIVGGVAMAPLAVLMGAVMPMTAMSYDEQSHWNTLAMMMPYSRKDIVLSKFILGYAFMAVSGLFFLLIHLAITLFMGGSIQTVFLSLFSAILSGLFFIALSTPILFKFGTQKGRFVFIVFVAIASALGTLSQGFLIEIQTVLSNYLPLILLAAAVIANAVSIFICLHIKKS